MTAVEELVKVGDSTLAATLIDDLDSMDGALWWSLVGRVRWQLGDDDGAVAAYRRGLERATPGSREDVILHAEYARAVLLALGQVDEGLALASAAVALAERTGYAMALALAVLGTAEHYRGLRTASTRLIQAVGLAAADGDIAVEFTSANNLVGILEAEGNLSESMRYARQFADRAAELHLRSWQLQMTAMALNAAANVGDHDTVVAEVPAVLDGVVDRRTRDQLETTYGIALIDLGRLSTVIARVTDSLQTAVPDYFSAGSLLWIHAEAQLWSGNPRDAIVLAEQALELTPADTRALFPMLTRAHAQVQLGLEVEPTRPESTLRIAEGAPFEYDALVALSTGDREHASLLFTEAAQLWAGCHRRGELRCRWLAADSSGDDEAAREALITLERDLERDGWVPLLGQVRRSLRARGVRSGVARGRVGELTGREREVLDLVGEGLSTDAIAARLGLSPSTVAAQIASARARLGAASRWQAVADS